MRSKGRLLLAALVLTTAAGALARLSLRKRRKRRRSTKPQAPKPANIDRNGVLILVRTSLLALDQANKTGNYTVLRDLGAPGFQANSAARLGRDFRRPTQ